MPQFAKRIATVQGSLNFYFNRIYTVKGPTYHISVIDTHIKVHMFHMHKREGNWQIADPLQLPDWILAVENLLIRGLLDHLRSEG